MDAANETFDKVHVVMYNNGPIALRYGKSVIGNDSDLSNPTMLLSIGDDIGLHLDI